MNHTKKCPKCGISLDGQAVAELCPKCLLAAALQVPLDDFSNPTIIQRPPGGSEPLASDANPVPKIRYFGDYEILEEIARGGMGIVYRARQASLNRIVAVKVILSGEVANELDVRRFYTEAQAAAHLQHPNIVAIHEVGEHDRHYFSMDYIDGPDLGKVLRSGPLESRDAAAMLKKITEAVAYAHMQGTLHRDLKPSNILLDHGREPHVTDFGLAKRTAHNDNLTVTGAVLGTPAFMAPEQAAGHLDRVDGRSDVYGLGSVLYSMLTGRAPFAGESAFVVMQEVMNRLPVPPSKLNMKVPIALETICLKCLEKSPENRYASAIDLAADLTRFLQGQRILAKPPSNLMRTADLLRQNPWAVTGTVSFLMLWLFLGTFTLWDHGRFQLWEAQHPGGVSKQAFIPLNWGLSVFMTGFLTMNLFGYLVLFPPCLYANFATAKRKGVLTARKVQLFALVAATNVLLGVITLTYCTHRSIWNGDSWQPTGVFALLVLPAFWFGAHLLWLAASEWRGKQFGEQADEIAQVYGLGGIKAASGSSVPDRDRARNPSRAQSNLFVGFVALFIITSDLIGAVHMLHYGIWIGIYGAIALAFSYRAILAWKRHSRIATQLFWFVGLLASLFWFLLMQGAFKLGIKTPGPFLWSACTALVASCVCVAWSKAIADAPRPTRLWDSSRFMQWLVSTPFGQGLFLALVAFVLFVCPHFETILLVYLAGRFPLDLFESALAGESRKKELCVSTFLSLIIIGWYYFHPSFPAWGLSICYAMTLGLLTVMILLLTCPVAPGAEGRRRVVLGAAGIATVLVPAILVFLFLPRPRTTPLLNQLQREAGPGLGFPLRAAYAYRLRLIELENWQDSITGHPPAIKTDAGEMLVRGYAELGLVSEGHRYLKRILGRVAADPEGVFKVQLLRGHLSRLGGKGIEAASIYDQLSEANHFAPAAAFHLAGPFPGSTPVDLPSANEILKKALPNSVALFGRIIDLSSVIGTNSDSRSFFLAVLRLRSPIAQTISMKLSVPGNAVLWVNGEEKTRFHPESGFNLDNAVVPALNLKEGENTLVLKLHYRPFPAVAVRFVDPDGGKPASLKFD